MAELAGVSAITVSRVLRTPAIVAEETRRRVEEAVDRLGYVPNLAAGTLASLKSRLVAVIVPTLRSSVYADTIQGLSDELSSRRLSPDGRLFGLLGRSRALGAPGLHGPPARCGRPHRRRAQPGAAAAAAQAQGADGRDLGSCRRSDRLWRSGSTTSRRALRRRSPGEGRRERARRFSAAIRRGKRGRRSASPGFEARCRALRLRAPIVEPLIDGMSPERGRGRLPAPGRPRAGHRRAVLPQRRARHRGADGGAAAIDRRARPHADRRLRRLRSCGPCHAAADDGAGAGLRDRPPRRPSGFSTASAVRGAATGSRIFPSSSSRARAPERRAPYIASAGSRVAAAFFMARWFS